jgi:proline iminopeptidase
MAVASYTQPDEHGLLDVGDGHSIYWEAWGERSGKPAVVLHGGPGSGCAPWWVRYFDLARCRVCLFDQRGCGRSTPSAATDLSALTANTTRHLVSDVERLRASLGVERWLVLGGSWGSTLGLAYAQSHPEAVSAMVLFSVVTTTAEEVEWGTRAVGRFFPEEWQRFRDGVPAADRDGNLAEAFGRLLSDSDPAVQAKAARDWCAWEDRHVRTRPQDSPDPRYEDPAFRLGFARLVTHYWSHAGFLGPDELLRGVTRLNDIPGVLVHGRMDLSAPLDVPWRLAQSWQGAQLIVADDEGHRGGASMTAAVASAVERFARS